MIACVDRTQTDSSPENGAIDAFGATRNEPSLSDARAQSTRVPRKIGRFTILESIGAGAMGVVYSAYDTQLDRKVAIKVLREDTSDIRTRQRLLREAQALARVTHPNVVTVHEVGEHDQQLYLAMEFIQGQTLGEWVGEQGPQLAWQDILKMFVCAGNGLVAAHQAGLVHRDFKPHNVLVHGQRATVVDFGLARLAWAGPAQVDEQPTDDPEMPDVSARELGELQTIVSAKETGVSGDAVVAEISSSGGALHSPLTRAGAVLGTPAYMAIEQFRGEEATAKSDQYAFCVALFEALEGRRPFVGNTIYELIDRVGRGPTKDLWAQPYPQWLREAINRGLSPDPDARWPTMLELLQEIDDHTNARDSHEQRRQLRKILLNLAILPPAFWVVLELIVDPERGLQPVDTIFIWLTLAVLVCISLVIWRRAAFRPGTNRWVSFLLLVLLAFIGINRIGSTFLGQDVHEILFSDLLLFSIAFAIATGRGGLSMLGASLFTLLGAVLILALPQHADTIYSLFSGLLVPFLIVGFVRKTPVARPDLST